ncbi:MAG: DUF4365 domain-containing protein [Bacteroidota bacterium]
MNEDKFKLLRTLKGHKKVIYRIVWSPDGTLIASSSEDGTAMVWDYKKIDPVDVFTEHNGPVMGIDFSHDSKRIVTSGIDRSVRMWNVCRTIQEKKTNRNAIIYGGHYGAVWDVSCSPIDDVFVSASDDMNVRVWKCGQESPIVSLRHQQQVWGVSYGLDGKIIASCSSDGKITLWDTISWKKIGECIGHFRAILTVCFSPDGKYLASASSDQTVRIWDVRSLKTIAVLEGHRRQVDGVSFSHDSRLICSKSHDGTVRVWSLINFQVVAILQESKMGTWIAGVSFHPTLNLIATLDKKNEKIRLWEFDSEALIRGREIKKIRKFTCAKVLLIGETGVGKTGLSKRLASNFWEASDSTVGTWATQWKLPDTSDQEFEHEIWLWDFGGQADQRLIHQLYMDETALAVLVFDGQKEDLFETLAQWDRDLMRASRKKLTKLLVAGRVDTGDIRTSRNKIEKFAAEHNFIRFLETSAKTNQGCEELREAILSGIAWDEIPCSTTEVLFKRLKEEIIELRDKGYVMMRFNELYLKLKEILYGEFNQFSEEELHTVLRLLSGPGVLWELSFGSWLLLQPERINAYAQAVIRTLQSDDQQRGCIMEDRVLKGDLMYESSMLRLENDEERFVLLAMHQTLVEKGLCLRQPTAKGNLLIFPCYYRLERPEQPIFPVVFVSYHFTGFLDEIYATLVVHLQHTEPFQHEGLWRYAADFKTNTGKQLGVKMVRREPGMGEMEVYFDPTIAIEEKIIFSKYVHEHLLQYALEVERLRHYICPYCGTPVGNREVAMDKLNEWLNGRRTHLGLMTQVKVHKVTERPPSIICARCEQRVPLWDDLEQCFADPEIQKRVCQLQVESAIVLDNESKERILVGEVISTVAMAAQISREFNVSDHGIDMEIEFKDDDYEATGKKLYLQLKSGDSYLWERRKDKSVIFTIKKESHARYWMKQAFPVLLVIRNAEGDVFWMRIDDYLKTESEKGKRPVNKIIFNGERFDVISIRKWRDILLNA